jgi:hypothetical protein
LDPLPDCIANAPAGYRHDKRPANGQKPVQHATKQYPQGACVYTIDRANPIAPPAFLAPGNSTILLRVVDTRGNETVQVTQTTSHTATPDVGAAVLKGAVSPLQTLVLAQRATPTNQNPLEQHLWAEALKLPDPIEAAQKALAKTLNVAQVQVLNATNTLVCLETYQVVKRDRQPYWCSQDSLIGARGDPSNTDAQLAAQKAMSDTDNAALTNPQAAEDQKALAALVTPNDYSSQKSVAVAIALHASTLGLPVSDVKSLDGEVTNFLSGCFANTVSKTADEKAAAVDLCLNSANLYQANEARIDTALTTIQTAQAALIAPIQALTTWPPPDDPVAFEITAPKLNSTTLTIAGIEVVTKTSSAIATVTINWQTNHVVLSTGIVFSGIRNYTYANSPLISAGQPVLDPTGKTLTEVTQQHTSPSIGVPTVLISFRFGALSRARWETKCPNSCSFLFSAGVSGNMTTKSADFDVGPSSQFGGVLITPTAHFGREQYLTNGLKVGDELGPSPPSPLPTNGAFRTTWGISNLCFADSVEIRSLD